MERFKSLGLGVQLIITVVLMAIIGFVGWKYFPNIQKTSADIKSQQTKLDELNAEIQKGVNLEKKLPELEREIANLESQLEQLKTIMPPARIDSEIVAKLESLAKRSRLLIKQLTPQRPRKKDFYDEYPIAIELQANYHDLAKFFDRMAHLPRIFNVGAVSLRTGRATGGTTVSAYSIDASFTAMTFIYRDEPPPPPPPKVPKQKPPGEEKLE